MLGCQRAFGPGLPDKILNLLSTFRVLTDSYDQFHLNYITEVGNAEEQMGGAAVEKRRKNKYQDAGRRDGHPRALWPV